MRITGLKPAASTGGGMVVVATFDLELSDEVRLYGLRLIEAPDGNRMTYAAQAGSRRSATFARSLAEQITALASESLEAVTANGTLKAA